MDILRLAYFQMDIVWEAPQENLLQIKKVLEQHHKEMDMLVLPEMCLTGFTMSPSAIAEPWPNGVNLKRLKEFSLSYDVVLVGSLAVEEDGLYYNRGFVFERGEVIHVYDKRHLFSLASEGQWYTRGTEKSVFQFKGWSLNLAICYDLRFPVWLRNTEDYDLLIIVANWPEKRVEAWNALLKARAIENMTYVLGVNRVGTDANGIVYSGESVCFDPLGGMRSQQGSRLQIMELSKKELLQKRNRLGFLKDQDDFEIIF
ncbi:MAG: nitrilase-related carbon-nitrogen hydrolase [Flavobacteriaceae bacterium]